MLSKDTAVGFMARLDAGSAGEPEPKPEPFKRTLYPAGLIAGMKLARYSLFGWRLDRR